MKKTPLYSCHVALEAKMAPFAGYEMPIQYAGIMEETRAVRQKVGIFDVSHMGEIRVQGTSADAYLDWILSRPVSGKKTHLVSYAILLYPDGGAVDDLLTYRWQESGDYWLVVNAANKDKDFSYLQEMLPQFYEKYPELKQDITVKDESESYAQIAVQGPGAPQLMENLLKIRGKSQEFIEKVLALKGYRMVRTLQADGLSEVISRTGYTGEDGFEIYLPASQAVELWNQLIELGAEPAGLGARDALRLEAGMPLYGHEMSESINPLETGVGFAVKLDRPFVAEGRLIQRRKVIPMISDTRAIPREGYPVKCQGEEVGVVTSGSYSPTLEKGIANVLVPIDFPEDQQSFTIEIHHKDMPFTRTEWPFVQKNTL